jgi:Glyoxalase-like domain
MAARIAHTTIDCRRAFDLCGFWKALLDYGDVAEDPNLPGHDECMIVGPPGEPRLLFIEVPETKTIKDLMPTDRTRDEEIERALALGATAVADHRHPDGTGWLVLADPEGNEFCILRSQAERGEG